MSEDKNSNIKKQKKQKKLYIQMQQSQQIFLSVKHKLPQPNPILPSQIIKSQPAHHIRKHIYDITSQSNYHLPLDLTPQILSSNISSILNNYYGNHYDITQLLKSSKKIVFLNAMVNNSQHQHYDYYFGSIQTRLKHPRKSLPNTLLKQSRYQLQFDDKIESGNLYFALQHQPHTYLLANRLDYNTRSYGQWFYFKVTNITQKQHQFKFCIVNMTKASALFGKGLKISVCRNGVWGKQGKNIQYLPNKFIRKHSRIMDNVSTQHHTYFTLVFTLTINSFQTIYVAYNQPYTYTKLGIKLDIINTQNPNLTRSTICKTPLGNRIQMITISKKTSLKNKKIIFITARSHPIQTAGSFVMEGIIDQLTNNNLLPNVNQLLQNHVIKLIPMINPDGVILGNSRCNFHGFDLNRQWTNPNKYQCPQILNIKQKILKYTGRISMFIDLHGHSKKKSVFAYGCHDIRNPIASRQFPYLLSKLSQKNFIYNQCRFTILNHSKKNKKDGTARVALWKHLKIPNIFTIQSSYCCALGSNYHYDYQSYADIGKQIVQTLCQFLNNSQQLVNISTILNGQKTINSVQSLRLTALQDLKSNSLLISQNIKRQQQISSDSQKQDRILQKIQLGRYKTKQSKNPKIQLIKKSQIKIKQTFYNKNIRDKLKQKIKNITIDIKNRNNSKDDQRTHSTSNIQRKLNRKSKNVSPLFHRKQLALAKCQSIEENSKQYNLQKIQKIQKTTQYSKINLKTKPTLTKQKNTISVIQIGIDKPAVTPSFQNHHLLSVLSAKTIKRQNLVNNIKINLIKINNSQHIKHKSFQKPILQFQSNQFSDKNQQLDTIYQQKNHHHFEDKNFYKIQDFFHKFNFNQLKKKNLK